MPPKAVQHLHRAASLLARAKTASALSWGQHVAEDEGDLSIEDTGIEEVIQQRHVSKKATHDRRSWNRLRAVTASLEELLSFAEAGNEDRCLDIALRQYEKAFDMRGRVDAQCEREEHCIRCLRVAISEIERDKAREGRHEAPQVPGAYEQLAVLEAQQAEMEAELQSVSHSLAESTARNMGTQAKVEELEKAISEEIIADKAAMAQLGVIGDLGKFKLAKERERHLADEKLDSLQAHFKAEKDKLEENLADKCAEYKVGVEQLQREYEMMKVQCRERREEIESVLTQFSSEQDAKVREFERLASEDMRRLVGLRQQKTLALHSEVQRNQQKLDESAEKTQKHMDAYVRKLRVEFKKRDTVFHKQCARTIEQEHVVTQESTERNAKWLKQAERMSGIYVAATADQGLVNPQVHRHSLLEGSLSSRGP